MPVLPVLVPVPNRPVSALNTCDTCPSPGYAFADAFGSVDVFRYEIPDCAPSPFVPPEFPTRMINGVPSELSCCAMMWSSDVPTGNTKNNNASKKTTELSVFGVTGCSVKYD